MGRSVVISATPIALNSSVLAASSSSVLTLSWCWAGQWSRSPSGSPAWPVAAAGHRLVCHPDDGRLELIGAGILGGGDDVAREQSIFGVRLSVTDWPAMACPVTVAGDDPVDPADPARRQDSDLVAEGDPAAGDLAGEAAETLVGAADPLHRHPERLGGIGGAVDRHAFEMIEQSRTGIQPTHCCARLHCRRSTRKGYRDPFLDPDPFGEAAVVGGDRFEQLLDHGRPGPFWSLQGTMRRIRPGCKVLNVFEFVRARPCAHRPAAGRGRRSRRRSPCCGCTAHGRACRRR